VLVPLSEVWECLKNRVFEIAGGAADEGFVADEELVVARGLRGFDAQEEFVWGELVDFLKVGAEEVLELGYDGVDIECCQSSYHDGCQRDVPLKMGGVKKGEVNIQLSFFRGYFTGNPWMS